jgi:hypothetical protein
MSLKYYPSISWEEARKMMTNEFRIQTSEECKARLVACSNLFFVHIAVHPTPPPKDTVLPVHCLELHMHVIQTAINLDKK